MASLVPTVQEGFQSSSIDQRLTWMFLPPEATVQTGTGHLALQVPGSTGKQCTTPSRIWLAA